MDEFLSISYDITKIYRRFDNDYLYINKTCVTLCLSLNFVKFNEKIGLSIIFNYDCWSLYRNIPVALCLSFRKYDFEISSGSTLKLDNIGYFVEHVFMKNFDYKSKHKYTQRLRERCIASRVAMLPLTIYEGCGQLCIQEIYVHLFIYSIMIRCYGQTY